MFYILMKFLPAHCGVLCCTIQFTVVYMLYCSAVQVSKVMQFNALQHNTLHCIALHCIALHCIALHCIAVQCSAVQCSAVQCSAVQCGAVQCSAVQCSAVQYLKDVNERMCEEVKWQLTLLYTLNYTLYCKL